MESRCQKGASAMTCHATYLLFTSITKETSDSLIIKCFPPIADFAGLYLYMEYMEVNVLR